MANKTGKNIRTILAVLEQVGPTGGSTIHDHLPDIERYQIGKYLHRAVCLGLASVERGRGTRHNYNVYTADPDWRQKADQRKTTKLPPPTPRPPKRTLWSGISSIFNMGVSA